MLSFPTPSVYQSSKCFVTYGTMSYPDPKQPPSKGKPWSKLLGQQFVHKVDLVLPQECLERVRGKLTQDAASPVYHKVIMTLGQILHGDFFTQYIKIGNVLMLSEGQIGKDDVFSLKDGRLTLYLEKETYERAGLTGQPHGVKGKRGLRPRWIVSYDLRNTASFPGKKGFDRLVYAAKNVLNKPLAWMFCNLSLTPVPDPLQTHFPTRFTSSPLITEAIQANVPALHPSPAVMASHGRSVLEEYATEIYEWLSLVRLESPRITVGDKVDHYLARYAIPGIPDDATADSLCKVSWEGFISPTWARETLVDCILALPSATWFSLSVTSFGRCIAGDGTECTIFRPPKSPGHYFLWDIHAHE